jgi:hypothetical protein
MLTAVIMANEDLPAIDPGQLEAVTGGVTSGSSDPNAQVTAMLQQLLSSIGDLAHNQNGGGNNSFMQMLPIIMMMRSRQSAPAPAPVAAPPPGDGWVRVS